MKKTFDFIEGFLIFFVEAEAQKSSEGRRFSEGAKTFAATLIDVGRPFLARDISKSEWLYFSFM